MESVGPENSSRALSVLRGRLDGLSTPDGRLPTERELAAELGVGRRAVRRALEVLEAEGLIWRKQGKGTFIGSKPSMASSVVSALVDRTNPVEVFEARMHLEPQLAGLAALRATQDDVRRMRKLCERIARAHDGDARELWDEALHRLIGQAAGNSLLFGVHEILEEVRRDEAWRSLRERARTAAALATYNEQHHAIIEAIAARDPGASEAAMRAHIAALSDNILAHNVADVSIVG